MPELLLQLVRFGLVGFVNAAVDAAVFFSALALLTDSLVAANSLAWVVAVTCSYVLNSRFTFAANPRRPLRFSSYSMFALTQVGGFVAHTAVLVATAPYVWLPLAKVIGIGVGFLVNFTLARAIVFRKP